MTDALVENGAIAHQLRAAACAAALARRRAAASRRSPSASTARCCSATCAASRALTEQMAARGPDGVEIFTAAMNRYFGGMIDCVGEHGGEVISFAGDALLASGQGDQGRSRAALDAAADCALDARRARRPRRRGRGRPPAGPARRRRRRARPASRSAAEPPGLLLPDGPPLERVSEAIAHAERRRGRDRRRRLGTAARARPTAGPRRTART